MMNDMDSSDAGSITYDSFCSPIGQQTMRRSFVNEIIPFYEIIKNLSQNLDTDIYIEVKEFERSLDKMESDYDKCLADNKRLGDKNKHLLAKTRRLQRVMTNLSNDNECFIADNIAKDICFFVLSSEKQVSPRSNCSCKEHVARQCKEPKRAKDSQYFKDKMLLMEAKEKGAILDAEAEAFLADVECTAPYDQPLAMTTTNIFEANHEDAYDSDVDEGPNAAVAFMANLSSTSATNNPVNDGFTLRNNQIFD
ncbi:hypothetical protein Tco_0703273 [Tanacetum coccineum]|uniref:Uncharacterized protein n=1 Tax=Tanacetum coccineum TaxID=301880 RepID=A0ABQ4XZP5_9ASTR